MNDSADLVALVTAITALLALIAKVVSDVVRNRRARAAEVAAAPNVAKKLEADLAEQAQRIYTGALEALTERFEAAEEEHSKQIAGLRIEMRRRDENHAAELARLESSHDVERRSWHLQRDGLKDHIGILVDVLREHDIPVPDLAERTA